MASAASGISDVITISCFFIISMILLSAESNTISTTIFFIDEIFGCCIGLFDTKINSTPVLIDALKSIFLMELGHASASTKILFEFDLIFDYP